MTPSRRSPPRCTASCARTPTASMLRSPRSSPAVRSRSVRQIVEVEVREARARERDSERVAACAGECILGVAADPDACVRRSARASTEKRRSARRALVGRERRPCPGAIGPRRQRHDRDRENAADEPGDDRSTSGRARGRGDVAESLLVLDELAEPEVGVLGSRSEAAALAARPSAAAAEHELDLRGEQHDEREPERDPRAEVLDEQPRDDEDEPGSPQRRLDCGSAQHDRQRMTARTSP